MKTNDYLRLLVFPFAVAALFFVLSQLINLRYDPIAALASLATFVSLALQKVGAAYCESTKQPKLVKHGFGMIANPLAALIPIATFFYIVVGRLPGLFFAFAMLIALILFALEFVGFYSEVKSKQ